MPEDGSFETLKLLYQENAKIAATFWEWRNKIITYFSTSIVGLLTLAGWLYEQRQGGFISAPLFIGAILSFVLTLLDERNGEILKATYKCGKAIEMKLLQRKEDSDTELIRGIFTLISEAHPSREPSSAHSSPRRISTYTKAIRYRAIVQFFRRPTYTKTLKATFTLLAIAQLLFALAFLICPTRLSATKL
jgi:hypothetical protein